MTSSLARQAVNAPAFLREAWPDLRSQAAATVKALPQRPGTVLLCGCGDSHHASDSLSHAFRSWGKLSALGSPAMQTARYLVPELSRDPSEMLLIGVSVSGATARTLEAIELGRQRGLHTLAITSQPESALAQLSGQALCYGLPEYPTGPGLMSYLGSLLAGLALASELAPQSARRAVDQGIEFAADALAEVMQERWSAGTELADLLTAHLPARVTRAVEPIEAERYDQRGRLPITFLGSGPTYGSAMFAAAKLIEAAGWPAWAQDTEEWAHLEYFADPAQLPVWLLSAGGRAADREQELARAAERIGRHWLVSRWKLEQLPDTWLREPLSPLGLWVGPVALADAISERLDERPFRGFGGGRSTEQGGGVNQIQSSRRIASLK